MNKNRRYAKLKKAGMITVTTAAMAGVTAGALAVPAMASEVYAQDVEAAAYHDVDDARQAVADAEQVYNEVSASADQAQAEWEEAKDNAQQAQEDYDAAVKAAEDAFGEVQAAAESADQAAADASSEAKIEFDAATENEQSAREEAAQWEQEAADADAALQTIEAEVTVTQDDIDQKTQEYSGYQEAEEAAKQGAEEARAQAEAAEGTVSDAQAAVAAAQNDAADAQNQYDAAEQAVAAAQTEADRCEADLQNAQGLKDGTISIEDTQAYQDKQAAETVLTEKEQAAAAAQGEQNAAQQTYDAAAEQTGTATARVSWAETDASEKQAAADQAEAQHAAAIEKSGTALTAYEGAQSQTVDAQKALDDANTEVSLARISFDDANKEKEEADAAVIQARQQVDSARADAEAQYDADLVILRNDVTAKQAAAEKAAQDLADAETNYQRGYFGFVDWMLMKNDLTDVQKKDLQDAQAFLNQCLQEDLSVHDRGNEGNAARLNGRESTNVLVTGDEKDASSLKNVENAIIVLKDINERRKTDENFAYANLQDGLTNFYLMAVAQAQTMKGAYIFNHSTSPRDVYTENLAWGYSPQMVNKGWYEKEKSYFDAAKNQLGITTITNDDQVDEIAMTAYNNGKVIGHYTNLMSFTTPIMGVGYTTYGSYGQTTGFNSAPESSNNYYKRAAYTIDDFERYFVEYKATLDKDNLQAVKDTQDAQYAAAKAQLNAMDTQENKEAVISAAVQGAQTELEAKQQNASQAAARVTFAQTELNARNAQAEQAGKDKAAAEEMEAAAKLTYENAVADENTAKGNAQDANAKLTAAQAEVTKAQEALTTAQEAEKAAKDILDEKTLAKENADQALAKARADHQEAVDRLASLTSDDTIAALQTAREEAETVLGEKKQSQTAMAAELQAAKDLVKSTGEEAARAQTEWEAAKKAQEEAEKVYEGAKQDTVNSGAELQQMQEIYAPVQAAAQRSQTAAAELAKAKDSLKNAEDALKAAKEYYQKCLDQQEITSADLAELKKILEEAGIDGEIEHDSYLYLNSYTSAVRNSRSLKTAMDEALAQAEDKLEGLKKDKNLAYSEYAAAKADLILAQAEAQKAADEAAAKKAAQEAAAKKTAGETVVKTTAEETAAQKTEAAVSNTQAEVKTEETGADKVQASEEVLLTAAVQTETAAPAVFDMAAPQAVYTAAPVSFENLAAAQPYGIPAYEEAVDYGVYTPVFTAAAQGHKVAQAETLIVNRVLENGAEGEDVRMVQQRLAELGFLAGDISSEYGDFMRYAVMAFQEANGLEADGLFGPATLAAINGNPVSMDGKIELTRDLEPGMKGLDVFKVQKKLFDLGYFEDVPNGTFEDSTTEAILKFQEENGMEDPSGIMDSETLELLNEAQVPETDVTAEA